MKKNWKKIVLTAGSITGLVSVHAFAESGGAASAAGFGTYGTIIWMVVLVGLFYFMLIRPQKKREKQERELRNNLKPGDKIITIGGFTGKVLTVRDDDVTFETGAAKTRLTVKKWAVQTKESEDDTAVAETKEEPKPAETVEEKKEEK